MEIVHDGTVPAPDPSTGVIDPWGGSRQKAKRRGGLVWQFCESFGRTLQFRETVVTSLLFLLSEPAAAAYAGIG